MGQKLQTWYNIYLCDSYDHTYDHSYMNVYDRIGSHIPPAGRHILKAERKYFGTGRLPRSTKSTWSPNVIYLLRLIITMKRVPGRQTSDGFDVCLH